MSQINYIKNVDIPSIDGIGINQTFYFSSFLFYMNSWSWDNIKTPSNINFSQVRESLNTYNFNDPFNCIKDIKLNSAPNNTIFTSINDCLLFPELYLIAATCRRYQIYNEWREKFIDITSPQFLESYSEDTPSKTPILAGELTWSLWSGDIQAFTNSPGGRLAIGSYLFCKKMDLQKYTPVSIEVSSKNNIIGRGYGELQYDSYGNLRKNITNYYNDQPSYLNELSTLQDGWYGVVTLDSTPYVIEPGTGINFDAFINLKDNKILEFHPDYPSENYIDVLSEYGQRKKQYIDS